MQALGGALAGILFGAGLVLFAKTTTPEFGLTTTTESTLFGQTRNPWNLEYTSASLPEKTLGLSSSPVSSMSRKKSTSWRLKRGSERYSSIFAA